MTDETLLDGLWTPEMVPLLPPVQIALARVARDVGPIAKADQNREQGFAYRGIERIMERVGPALHRHGVTLLPNVTDVAVGEMARGRGDRATMWRHVLLTVRYTIVGPAGDTLEATIMGEGLDNADKATSKALTMAHKSCLLQVLGIGDGQADADQTTPPEAEPPHVRQATKAQGSRKAAAPRQAADAPAPEFSPPFDAVAADHGPAHARLLISIVDALNAVDQTERAAAKRAFVETWGLPHEVRPSEGGNASSWVSLRGWVAPDPRPEEDQADTPTPEPDPFGPCQACADARAAGNELGCALHEPF